MPEARLDDSGGLARGRPGQLRWRERGCRADASRRRWRRREQTLRPRGMQTTFSADDSAAKQNNREVMRPEYLLLLCLIQLICL